MSVWREVQEALYGRFAQGWGARSDFCFDNEPYTPADRPWVRLRVVGGPGQIGTLGPRGRWDLAGQLFILCYEPPGKGVGASSDSAELARNLFRGQRFEPHDIRFGALDIGGEAEVDGGRWWGVTVSGPFSYEERR